MLDTAFCCVIFICMDATNNNGATTMTNLTTYPKTQTSISSGDIVKSKRGMTFIVVGFNNSIASEEHAIVKCYDNINGAAGGSLALPVSALEVLCW